MTPLKDAEDAVLAALKNCEDFDIGAHFAWLQRQPERLQKTAMLYPPNRVYEKKGRFFCIIGYGKDGHVVCAALRDDTQAIHMAPGELKDVTDDLRADRGLPVGRWLSGNRGLFKPT